MRYHDLLESLPVAVFLMNDTFEESNERACLLLACKRGEIIGHSLLEFAPSKQPDGRDSEAVAQQHVKAAFLGSPQLFYWQALRKDGVLIDTEISMASIKIDGKTSILSSIRDITEHKQVKEALHESEEGFRSVFKFAASGMVVVSPQGEILQINPAMCRILGFPEQQLLKKKFIELTHPGDREKTGRFMKELLAGQHQFVEYEKRFLREDGSVVWGHSTVSLVHDANRNPLYFVGLVQDITDRKRAEEALQERNEFIETIMDNLPIGLSVMGWDDRKVQYMNRKVEEIIGWPSEILADEEAFFEHVFPDPAYRQEIKKKVHTGWASGDSARMIREAQITKQSGETAEILGVEIPMFEKNLLISTFQDITERKRAEGALRESEEKFRSIFEFTAAGMGIVSPQGEILQINPAMCRILGFSEQELLKKKLIDLTHPADREDTNRFTKELLAGQRQYIEQEKRFLRKDGSVVWGHSTVSLVHDANRNPLYFVGLVQDITDSKRAEEEIRQLNQELEARVVERTRELELANRELEAFTYAVAHDLRAPLRAIDGFSEALLEDYQDKLDEDGKKFLRYLQEGSSDMSELIDGLLRLSRSTRGEMVKERIDLSALVKTVVAELRQAEPEQQVAFQVAVDMQVDVDPRLIKVVLENLLGNAWKYSSQTTAATVEFGVEEQEGGPVYFVRDNGAGFDMAFADKLFLPFQRLHKTDEFTGTGIGLATVERIIHRHGGKIWAEATVGEGASFYFTLGEEGKVHG